MKYARVLIEHCPKEATQMFIDYYTGKYQQKTDALPAVADAPVPSNGGFAAGAASAVQNLSNLLPLPYMNTSAVASPATLGNVPLPAPGVKVIADQEALSTPAYKPPTPRSAFSSFIDHPDEFIVFLEACLKEQSLLESDKRDLNTTLFEMYLHKSAEKKGEARREEWEEKAKGLIASKDGEKLAIEESNILLLSHLSDFREGTTLVKEQSGLLFDIFRSYTSAKDTRGAIKALRKYGPEEPQLYPAALSYFTSDTRILEEAGPDELNAVLTRIDKDGLMAPLQVVQTLAKNGVATMGMIKPYLAGRIEREQRDIASNRRDATTFRTETDQRRVEIRDLGGKPTVFQATRCSDCSLPLELPAVHFLCKHSFHQRCLRGGVEGIEGGQVECPVCAQDNATIKALKRSQAENAERHELFKDDLERSEDRFKTIAGWYGRGVMGVPGAE